MHLVGNFLRLDVVKPLVIDVHTLNHLRLDPMMEFFQLVCKLICEIHVAPRSGAHMEVLPPTLVSRSIRFSTGPSPQ